MVAPLSIVLPVLESITLPELSTILVLELAPLLLYADELFLDVAVEILPVEDVRPVALFLPAVFAKEDTLAVFAELVRYVPLLLPERLLVKPE